jgi:hypothetical protein
MAAMTEKRSCALKACGLGQRKALQTGSSRAQCWGLSLEGQTADWKGAWLDLQLV